MPWQDTELGEAFFTIQGIGPVAQTTISQNIPPLTNVAAGVPFDTGVIISNGYQLVACAITSVVAGSLVITRYLDREGTILSTTALTTAITAATPAVAIINSRTDGFPFASFRISFTVTGGVQSTISGFYVLLQSS